MPRAFKPAKVAYSHAMNPRTLNWKPLFVAALREIPVLRYACEAVGVNRVTAWRARQTDEEFAAEWDSAMEDAIDKAEQEALRRGVDGWHEPVIDKGRLAWAYERFEQEDGTFDYRPIIGANGQPVPLTVRKHSDALLQFVLKGRRRTVYGDKQEITGNAGGPITILDETKRAARLAALLAMASERREIG